MIEGNQATGGCCSKCWREQQKKNGVDKVESEMQKTQPPTPIKTDNATANGFIHDNIHQKRSKSWDMRYYWLRDRQLQKQFQIFWEKALSNLADYFTKHHPTKHHRQIRGTYIKDNDDVC